MVDSGAASKKESPERHTATTLPQSDRRRAESGAIPTESGQQADKPHSHRHGHSHRYAQQPALHHGNERRGKDDEWRNVPAAIGNKKDK